MNYWLKVWYLYLRMRLSNDKPRFILWACAKAYAKCFYWQPVSPPIPPEGQ